MKRNQVVKIADTETDMCVISVGKKYMKNSTMERRRKMAKKMKISKTQMKIEVIEKLASLGINTEEQLEKLTPKELLGVESLSFKEIELIGQLQECVNENMLFSFLTAEMTAITEKPKVEKPIKKKKENNEVISDGE